MKVITNVIAISVTFRPSAGAIINEQLKLLEYYIRGRLKWKIKIGLFS